MCVRCGLARGVRAASHPHNYSHTTPRHIHTPRIWQFIIVILTPVNIHIKLLQLTLKCNATPRRAYIPTLL